MNNQQIRTESQLKNQQKTSPLQLLKLEQLDGVSGGPLVRLTNVAPAGLAM